MNTSSSVCVDDEYTVNTNYIISFFMCKLIYCMYEVNFSVYREFIHSIFGPVLEIASVVY